MSFLKPKSVTEVNDYSPLIFFGKMGLFMNDPNAPLQGRKEAWVSASVPALCLCKHQH